MHRLLAHNHADLGLGGTLPVCARSTLSPDAGAAELMGVRATIEPVLLTLSALPLESTAAPRLPV